ncbi:MAG: TraB/TrbI/VirB10 family type IV secretion system protein [Leptospirales bacterium]
MENPAVPKISVATSKRGVVVISAALGIMLSLIMWRMKHAQEEQQAKLHPPTAKMSTIQTSAPTAPQTEKDEQGGSAPVPDAFRSPTLAPPPPPPVSAPKPDKRSSAGIFASVATPPGGQQSSSPPALSNPNDLSGALAAMNGSARGGPMTGTPPSPVGAQYAASLGGQSPQTPGITYAPSLPGIMPAVVPGAAGAPGTGPALPTPAQTAHQENGFYARMAKPTEVVSLARLSPPASPFELAPGTVIPGTLDKPISTDIPGQIEGRVSRDVYNDIPGHEAEILIPQGSRLIGQYNSQVNVDQTRVQVAWRLLVMPDKSTIDLSGSEGDALSGAAGFQDQVDNHYLKLFGSALALSVFSVAGEIGSYGQGSALSGPSYGTMATGMMGENMAMTGQGLFSQGLSVSPTLSIRKGYPFNVFLQKALVFKKPWAIRGGE